jgi:hypothetical protein
VRKRGQGDTGAISIEEFINKAKQEINHKVA